MNQLLIKYGLLLECLTSFYILLLPLFFKSVRSNQSRKIDPAERYCWATLNE